MKQNKFNHEEEIVRQLQEYYDEAMAKKTFGIDINDDENYRNLQMKLLQTTQEFARGYDYDLGNTPSLKRKIIVFIKKIIRKSTRFMLKPYADQMLRYQETNGELSGEVIKFILQQEKILDENQLKMKEQAEAIKKQQDQLWKHEEAIYKLTNDYNDIANLFLKLSGELNSTDDKKCRSYSQAGEDKIIDFLMNYGKSESVQFTYLDIGCNHYKVINNTYLFYEMGMHGVLIDANPNFISLAEQNRPKDICINAGISSQNKESLKFYILNNPDLSSFNKEVIDEAIKESPWLKVEKEIMVPVISINEIIEKYFSKVPEVISLDIEGDELNVLKSMDFKKYRPNIFVIETIVYKAKISLSNKRDDIIHYMEECGYKEYAFTGVNSIFINESVCVEG